MYHLDLTVARPFCHQGTTHIIYHGILSKNPPLLPLLGLKSSPRVSPHPLPKLHQPTTRPILPQLPRRLPIKRPTRTELHRRHLSSTPSSRRAGRSKFSPGTAFLPTLPSPRAFRYLPQRPFCMPRPPFPPRITFLTSTLPLCSQGRELHPSQSSLSLLPHSLPVPVRKSTFHTVPSLRAPSQNLLRRRRPRPITHC